MNGGFFVWIITPKIKSKMSNSIHWYEKAAFDAPHLNSPQPCIHGAGCVYMVKSADGVITPGCCRYVHPGEEGTGRRHFPARILKKDGKDIHQPACVRLTGNAGYYERRRLHLSWQAWCERNGIAYTPNKAGEHHAPVKRIGFGKRDDGAALGRLIADGAVARLNDPVEKEAIAAAAAAYIASHPGAGWEEARAIVKAAQEKDAPPPVRAPSNDTEPVAPIMGAATV